MSIHIHDGFVFLLSTRCCSRHYCCFRMSLGAAVGFASNTGLMLFSNREHWSYLFVSYRLGVSLAARFELQCMGSTFGKQRSAIGSVALFDNTRNSDTIRFTKEVKNFINIAIFRAARLLLLILFQHSNCTSSNKCYAALLYVA